MENPSERLLLAEIARQHEELNRLRRPRFSLRGQIMHLLGSLRLLAVRLRKRLFQQAPVASVPIVLGSRCAPQKVSVVIPTLNAVSHGFFACLGAVRAQQGLESLEIVVVDSGSTDRTVEMAQEFQAKILTVQPAEFNHGTTRNLAAREASGELILFIVSDAILASPTLIADMANALRHDSRMVALSCRQVARPDADLFAGWELWNHQRFLGGPDRMALLHGQQTEDPAALRRLAALDDVCALHVASVFAERGYRALEHAEDLEYGLRALRDGLGIGFLNSVGVCHSHNRSPAYHLSRYSVGVRAEREILGQRSAPYLSYSRLLSESYGIWGDLTLAAETCHSPSVGALCARVSRFLSHPTGVGKDVLGMIGSDLTLGPVYARMCSEGLLGEAGPPVGLRNQFVRMLEDFRTYLISLPGEVTREDFFLALEKLLAALVGSLLGCQQPDDQGAGFQKLHVQLAAGMRTPWK